MRPTEFTPAQIVEAGIQIQDSGRNVTGFAIRQKIGGGNPNRLKQVWDEHLASQTHTTIEPVAELPVEVAEEVAAVTKELTERIIKLTVELNDKAVKAAERRVTEVVRTAGEQREQAERELNDASQTVEDLESRLDEYEQLNANLEHRQAEALLKIQEQAVELATLRERLTAGEQTARSVAEAHEAVRAELESSLKNALAKTESLQAESGQLRDQLIQLRERLTVTEQVLQDKGRELEQSHNEARMARDLLEQERRDSSGKIEALQVQVAEAREAAAKLTGQLEAERVHHAQQASAGKKS